MTFDHPFILFGLTIFFPLIIIDIIAGRINLVPSLSSSFQLSNELKKKLFASVFFFRLFLAFAIIALAGPRWGTGYAPAEYYRGLDAVFAIDVSRSMDIRDAVNQTPHENSFSTIPAPSRLERGLHIARETILTIPGARYAAAVGRSRGYLAIPLTYDNESALVFLEAIDSSSITGRSTNLESLLEAAGNAFQKTSPARKVIVLISDGESHTGILRNILNHCANEGIIIITVAVGSDEGRLIPLHTDSPESEPVISRRDSAVMRNIAERTGGIYIDGGRDDAALNLSSHLISLSAETEPLARANTPKQRRSLFIILALAAYGASKFITRKYGKSESTWKSGGNFKSSRETARTASAVHTASAVRAGSAVPRKLQITSFVAAFLLLSSCSDGKLLLIEANYLHSHNKLDEAAALYMKALDYEEAAPYAEYGLGLTFYLLDQEDKALDRYSASQQSLKTIPENENRELRYRNHYNSGVIYFEKEDYHSAAASFREALRADPRKVEAKRNLELSLISISIEPAAQNNTESRQKQKEILFNYLREEEQQIWRSREWTAEEAYTGPDY